LFKYIFIQYINLKSLVALTSLLSWPRMGLVIIECSDSLVCKACVSEMKAEAEQQNRTGRACSMGLAPRSGS